jgi:gamma-glutamylcyclotransferase (GGCT)/AIG2-like uncharacterized protein YtfP
MKQYKYFAYGSNLDLIQMKRRCPSSKLISKGSLSDYRLTFNRFSSGWGGGVADVIQAQGSKVWGLVFEISDTDLERLDRYEGYHKDETSLYERWKTVIDTPNGQICDVWVYTVAEKQKFVKPTLEYLQIIKDAAKKWNFPKAYLMLAYLDALYKDCGDEIARRVKWELIDAEMINEVERLN